MTTTVKLENPTRSIKDVRFSGKKSYQKLSRKWNNVVDDITFEDKVLLEKSRSEFRNGQTVSRRSVMRFLSK